MGEKNYVNHLVGEKNKWGGINHCGREKRTLNKNKSIIFRKNNTKMPKQKVSKP